MRKMRRMVRTFSAISLLTIGACDGSGCIRIDTAVPLLEKPSPLGYPSTRPIPNRVIRMLDPGEYTYSRRTYDKDFVVYGLELPDGTHGHIIGGDEARECTR
jgi:hypothetical protein